MTAGRASCHCHSWDFIWHIDGTDCLQNSGNHCGDRCLTLCGHISWLVFRWHQLIVSSIAVSLRRLGWWFLRHQCSWEAVGVITCVPKRAATSRKMLADGWFLPFFMFPWIRSYLRFSSTTITTLRRIVKVLSIIIGSDLGFCLIQSCRHRSLQIVYAWCVLVWMMHFLEAIITIFNNFITFFGVALIIKARDFFKLKTENFVWIRLRHFWGAKSY